MSYVIFTVIGLSCGVIAAGGVFGLITKLHIVTRFADATNTKSYLMQYETAILIGATVGNIVFLFPISTTLVFANVIFVLFALFTGMFVGCLATALSETLNVTSVFSRRLRLHSHLGLIVLSASIGKFFGSLFYFML